MYRFVLATANKDKAKELTEILGDALGDVELEPRPAGLPDVDETGDTLAANARLKAAAICEVTGQIAIADDTGLEVDALDGAPGVYAARYAGENATYADNVLKMLESLSEVPPGKRTARFHTIALACFPDGTEIVASGTVEGEIATEGRGERGFGYDPIFVPEGAGGRTFAEITPEEKHALSHRGRAFRELAVKLKARLTNP